MVDDLLDFTATEAVLGKPVASDLREGKLTLPAIFLVERGGREAREKVATVLEDRAFTRVEREDLLRSARDSGAIDQARRLAEEYAERARRDLAPFAHSPYREGLAYLPTFILARDR
jgi:octaprenyl-diphosphate synthase